jgi:hypothetical protein
MSTTFFTRTIKTTLDTSDYEPLYGNYKFDTDLTDFGLVKEEKVRKVNRSGSILKLKNVKDTNSIYPMIDEFGYTFNDFFIFKSSWDLAYHLEIILNQTSTSYNNGQTTTTIIDDTNIGKSN